MPVFFSRSILMYLRPSLLSLWFLLLPCLVVFRFGGSGLFFRVERFVGQVSGSKFRMRDLWFDFQMAMFVILHFCRKMSWTAPFMHRNRFTRGRQ